MDLIVLNMVYWAVAMLNPAVPELKSRMVWLIMNVAYLPAARWLSAIHKRRGAQLESVISSSLQAVGSHLLVFTCLLYFLGIDTIRWVVFAEFYGVFTVVFLLWRLSSYSFVKHYRRKGGNFVRVVIVGCRTTGMRIYEEISSDMGFGYKCQGFFDIYCHPDFRHKDLYRGNLKELERFVRENKTEELFFTLSGEDREAVQQVVGICDTCMVKLHYVPPVSPYLNRNFSLSALGAVPVLEVRNNPLGHPLNSALKRACDILFSVVFLAVSPVIFVPVAIAVKLSSPGPVFFRQRRTGYKGNEFTCLKFRTMRVNANADFRQASKGDMRVTRVGDFLRRTSIDELPQFINVLKGDMSIVGPRPHMLRHTEDYRRLIDKYMVRHLIRPGITGLAQVRGFRGETNEVELMERRVEHDIWYIEHWSLMLDFKIIVQTAANMFRSEENAY
ncbi:MAG: undecaprenyl-phosphate glucose phosphotransferase [Duncaniella sp.]|nr:undecaprenyl-phosphate glucose phosphotransferase [Duncaniella sp.]